MHVNQFHSHFSYIMLSTNSWGKYPSSILAAKCYVHHLVANFICPLFGVGQVAYGGCVSKRHYESSEKNQKVDVKLRAINQNNVLIKDAKILRGTEGNCRVSDNYLWVCPYDKQVILTIVSIKILIIVALKNSTATCLYYSE